MKLLSAFLLSAFLLLMTNGCDRKPVKKGPVNRNVLGMRYEDSEETAKKIANRKTRESSTDKNMNSALKGEHGSIAGTSFSGSSFSSESPGISGGSEMSSSSVNLKKAPASRKSSGIVDSVINYGTGATQKRAGDKARDKLKAIQEERLKQMQEALK